MTDALHLFVGTYGQGLVPLTYRPASDVLELSGAVPAVENASYGDQDEVRGLHYLVNETDTGSLGVWRLVGGEWHCLLTVPSGGDAPCFVSLDAERQRVVVANYKSGTVAIYHLDEFGLPIGEAVVHRNDGRGPHAERQDGPHAHCVRFHHGRLYQTDLGTDEILVHDMDGTHSRFRLPAGQGPRHILFHPRHAVAYVLTELGSRIFTLFLDVDGSLVEGHSVSTLPDGADGSSLGGHLALNRAGDRLYASNRGHDSIAVFAVRDDGQLELRQIAPSHGKSPRFFRLLEDHGRMLVAHQTGNSLVCLGLDADGAIVGLLDSVAVEQPAYIGIL